jgi:ABC-type nitrate/sulfonate/bicarbonate transport system permease component
MRRRWRTAGRALGSLGGVVFVLVLVEALSRLNVIPSKYLPPPSVVGMSLAGLLGNPELWKAVFDTLLGWALGLGIAMLIAIPLGIVLASSELAYRATRPIIEFLRPVPSVALIPLVFLLFTPGLDGKVFLAVFAATWPLLVQTTYGVRNIQPVQLDTARSFQIPRWDVIRFVVLPSAIPYLATGIRIASTVSLILVLTGEIIMGAPGVGLEINRAREGGAVDVMYAYVIVAGVLGLLLNSIFAAIERRVLHWHPSHRMAVS